MENILIRFPHGLGDAVQFTTVLRHVRHFHPDWHISILAGRGKTSAFGPLADQVFVSEENRTLDDRNFERVFHLAWGECGTLYPDSPSTKAVRCLKEIFQLPVVPELLRYQIAVSAAAQARADAYVATLPGGDFMLLHHRGNTSQQHKDLTEDTAGLICHFALDCGLVPVILDWDRRSHLPDDHNIFCPDTDNPLWMHYGTGDAETLAALFRRATLAVCIDSGPQKVALSTDVPLLAVWTGYHPVHFVDGSPSNCLHLVPKSRADYGRPYFHEHYRHVFYDELGSSIKEMSDILGTPAQPPTICGFRCHPDKANQDWVIIQDIYLQDAYKTKLLPRKTGPEFVVDVGAHIGTFARLWHERNPEATIICVEACPENIELLQVNVGHFATVVHAACTYRTEPIYLLNAVSGLGRSTGGSRVVSESELQAEPDVQYAKDRRSLPCITLHEIMDRYGLPRIDVLKLDCEGSEFDILAQAPLDKIAFVLGEYHGFERWEQFRAERFPDAGFRYGHMSRSGDFGNFHIANRLYD